MCQEEKRLGYRKKQKSRITGGGGGRSVTQERQYRMVNRSRNTAKPYILGGRRTTSPPAKVVRESLEDPHMKKQPNGPED